MKTRNGFVSNSSSASFVVALRDLTEIEQCQILAYELYQDENNQDSWNITKDDHNISGWTAMDNSDLSIYLGENLTQKINWDD